MQMDKHDHHYAGMKGFWLGIRKISESKICFCGQSQYKLKLWPNSPLRQTDILMGALKGLECASKCTENLMNLVECSENKGVWLIVKSLKIENSYK